jgi:anti-sigma regulatory factor (Ser/Thr protein kinase)
VEVAAHLPFPVVESSQPSAVRFAARDLASRIGFSEADSYRAGLVATELATNLVKHAQAGQVLLRATPGADAQLEILALDKGPGIVNLSVSFEDGRSTAGTTGIGLGAARRMSDEFDIYSDVPRGTVVLARIRAKTASPPRRAVVDVSGVSVAKTGEAECGDAWTLSIGQDGFSALIADGLGHGHFAAQAANAAVAAASLGTGRGGCARTLEVVHDGLRHTRGAAAAMVEVALQRGVVTCAGVGNIGTSIVNNGSIRQAVSHNGTLGHQAHVFREYNYPWQKDSLLVMHSDGLISHWSLANYPGLLLRHPAVIAGVLYRDFNRGRDDVTVVVAREAA